MSVDSMAILILLGSFFVMVLLRFPIAYAVALSSVFCLLYQGLPLTTICQQMVKGISSFSLMAVPFFITMGVLMGKGGISDKLIALANACVGWMRGGLAMVNIVASYFFGGISGSAAAWSYSARSSVSPLRSKKRPPSEISFPSASRRKVKYGRRGNASPGGCFGCGPNADCIMRTLSRSALLREKCSTMPKIIPSISTATAIMTHTNFIRRRLIIAAPVRCKAAVYNAYFFWYSCICSVK